MAGSPFGPEIPVELIAGLFALLLSVRAQKVVSYAVMYLTNPNQEDYWCAVFLSPTPRHIKQKLLARVTQITPAMHYTHSGVAPNLAFIS